MNTSTIVQKPWNYCNVLRDDGTSYGDYVEQLTCLNAVSSMSGRGIGWTGGRPRRQYGSDEEGSTGP